MPSQYEIDTKFLEFLLSICFTVAIFNISFLAAITPSGMQFKLVQPMFVLFMILFTVFLGATFFIFIVWYSKYKTSLLKFRK